MLVQADATLYLPGLRRARSRRPNFWLAAGLASRSSGIGDQAHALGAGLAELGGGLLIALGLLTPLAAAAIAIVMLNAIVTVHWRNGFFTAAGGYEFNLLVFTAAVATAATGPGRFSLDNLYGWADNLSGLWWGVGVAGIAMIVSALTLTVGRGAWLGRGRREGARPASPGTAAR